mgnify:CR=1 FL=1
MCITQSDRALGEHLTVNFQVFSLQTAKKKKITLFVFYVVAFDPIKI